MASVEKRIETFKTWPRPEMNVHKLAAAGFFYAPIPGCTDRCIFYASGNALFNWDPADDPWAEYKKWYPQCPHVKRREANGTLAATASSATPLKTGSGLVSGIKSFFSSGSAANKPLHASATQPQAEALMVSWPAHIKDKDPAVRWRKILEWELARQVQERKEGAGEAAATAAHRRADISAQASAAAVQAMAELEASVRSQQASSGSSSSTPAATPPAAAPATEQFFDKMFDDDDAKSQVCVCVCVCARARVRACAFVCVCVCMVCACGVWCTHTHARTHTHTHTNTHTHTHNCFMFDGDSIRRALFSFLNQETRMQRVTKQPLLNQ
jgi:hypothetical protein